MNEIKTILINGVEIHYNKDNQKVYRFNTTSGTWVEMKGHHHQKKIYISLGKKSFPLDRIIFAFVMNLKYEDMNQIRIGYLDNDYKNLSLNNIYINTVESEDGLKWISSTILTKELQKEKQASFITVKRELHMILNKTKTSEGYARKTLYGKKYKKVIRTGESYV